MYSDEPQNAHPAGWPAAILTMDPASTGPTGLAVRDTRHLFTPVRKIPRTPAWHYSGSVWEPSMHDELGEVLHRIVPRGGHVLFAATSTAFQGVAMHLGRAIGCIEGLLHSLNVLPASLVPITDVEWRHRIFTITERKDIADLEKKARRGAWKALAVGKVKSRYQIDTDDNGAEAILLNDYVVGHRPDLYIPGAERP